MQSRNSPCLKHLLLSLTIFIAIMIPKTSSQQQYSFPLDQKESQYSSSLRALQEQIPSPPALNDSPTPRPPPDIKSLTIGKLLSSVNIHVCSILLSKDGRTAFAAIKYIGTLKILDISDYQYPRIIATLPLTSTGYFFKTKSLFLSPDEKTLFASTNQILEIIDISDLTAPVLLSTFNDPSLVNGLRVSDLLPDYYVPSFGLSGDSKTLFVGGIGLQIFNISSLSSPALTLSTQSPLRNQKFIGTGVAVLADGNTLIYANETLEIYNITNGFSLVKSYKTQGFASSVVVSKLNNQTVSVSGFDKRTKQGLLEKIDLSDITNPSTTETLQINRPCAYYPFITAVSSKEHTFFLMMPDEIFGYNLVIFSRAQRKVLNNTNTLLPKAQAVAISLDSEYIFTSANEQFKIIRLFKDYPNAKIFSLSNSTIETYQHSAQIVHAVASKYQEILFIGTSKTFDIVNISSQLTLSSYPLDQKLDSFQFSHDEKLVYIINTLHTLQILNITDFASPSLHGKFSPLNPNSHPIIDFICSPIGDVAFLLRKTTEEVYSTSLIDFSDLSSPVEIPISNTTSDFFLHKMVPSPDGNLFFFLSQNITIYNITNRAQPRLILTAPTSPDDADPGVVSCKISPDSTTMYLQTMDQNYYFRLRILNITNLTSIQTLSTLLLPKLTEKSLLQPLLFSSDLKKAYLIVQTDIMALDVSNTSSPVILGVAPTGYKQDLRTFMISADNKKVYLTNREKQTLIVNIETKYSLYINQEKFFVGKKYSDSIMFLKLDQESNYQLMNQTEYKVIKLLLSDLRVSPTQFLPEITSSSLPYWMTFDKENLALTIESKRFRDIGSYTLSSFLSNKLPLNAFDNLNQTVKSEDIITLLISLGYIDNQRFLTANFGAFDDFILGSQWESSIKDKIYQILRHYLIQTFTTFNVESSLDLIYFDNRVSVATASTNQIKIDIKLPNNNTQFLYKPYASSLLPVITEKKTRLTIEGSLKEINIALGEIIIDLENNTAPYPATITINDNLNPLITKMIQNVSQYFKVNQAPRVNYNLPRTIQEQIDVTTLFTGQYFAINLNESSFIDDCYPEGLSYELVLDSFENSLLPNWLTFNKLALKGTPPEEYLGREIHLVLIAKNEFKQTEVPITLKIKISTMFALKLVLRYCPYILTLIGLLVSANKIYNILAKKWYKHPKEFYLQIGEEITSEIIFPIRFFADEQKEVEIILKNMKNYLKKNCEIIKSLNKENIIHYFLDGETSLDETKITMAVRMTVDEMKEGDRKKLKLYKPGVNSRKEFIEQAIFSELIMWQLDGNKERETKAIFGNMKDEWAEIIEYNNLSKGFVINATKFEELLRKKKIITSTKMNESTRSVASSAEGDLGVSLLGKEAGFNVSLLKRALIVHVTRLHYVNIRDIQAHIFVKEKLESNIISRFLKLNEILISYNDKGKAGYGIEYKIENDVLTFFGTTHRNFDGKTLGVQITSLHQKILKEIWIHGVSDKFDGFSGERKDFVKSGYEVF